MGVVFGCVKSEKLGNIIQRGHELVGKVHERLLTLEEPHLNSAEVAQHLKAEAANLNALGSLMQERQEVQHRELSETFVAFEVLVF